MSTNVPAAASAGDEPSSSAAPAAEVAFGHFLVSRHADGSLVELGRGAMGVTYRAFDTGLRVEVALKVITADKVADANTRARFQREARAAAKIRHPNVASVLHLGEHGGEFFYAMEFISGRSLAQLLAAAPGRTLPPAVAVALAAQAAAALNAAHKKEVVHRDLKPENLMLLEGEAIDHEDERTGAAGHRQLKVIDFGLARRFGAGRQEDSFVTQSIVGFIGTPAYASPEQAGSDGGELDGRSDLYSLGIILWEMLLGRLPFTGNPMIVLSKHLAQAPPVAQLAAANVPGPIVELLAGLLQKDPAARQPQTAGELRTALDHLLRALAAEESTSTIAPAAVQATRKNVITSDTTVTPTVGTTLLARYRLGREMGIGDGGRLYLAADNFVDARPVALKLLPSERLAADPAFASETAAALALVRTHPHPVLLAPDGAGLQRSDSTGLFYVREWAAGFSLDELLRARHGELRAAEVFRLLATLPAALDHAIAAGFPWLSLALHKIFVVPAVASAEVDHQDWLGLRTRAGEQWPAFALKFNPLDCPPAASASEAAAAGLTFIEPRYRSVASVATPVAALARLVRELLGGQPEGLVPLAALNGEANAVLQRAQQFSASTLPGFVSAREFFLGLERAAGRAHTAPAPPPFLPPPPPPPPPPQFFPVNEKERKGPFLLLLLVGLLLLFGLGYGAVWLIFQPWQTGLGAVASPPRPSSLPIPEGTPDTFQQALLEGQRAFERKDYEQALAAYRRAKVLRPESSVVAEGLRQLDAVAARLGQEGKDLEESDPVGAVAKWRIGAALGNAKAQSGLGFMYLNGRGGLAKDEAEGVRWSRQAAEQSDPRGQNNLGAMYENGGGGLVKDEAEAVRWFRRAAEQGFAQGQVNLGSMYENGSGGLVKNEAEAVRWYRKAAEQGYAQGQNKLGIMYLNGLGGLAKNEPEALRWFRRAAEQGYAQGQSFLGFMYENGRGGLNKDETEAARWYRRAAEQGNAYAQKNLGVMYENGRGGLVKDEVEAVRWYRKAAEQGLAQGQTNLGFMYESGRGGLAKDETEAVRWYHKAADQDDPRGEANLGVMYLSGLGGLPKDDAEAVRWFRKSADQDYAQGQTGLGFMYENGRGGLTKSETEAVRWYRKAADQDDAQGQSFLGVMYLDGRGGLAKDELEAVRLFRRAAEQGFAQGQNNLGAMYENGRGRLAKNDAEAVRWYRKAAEQEFPQAQANLGDMYLNGRGGLAKDEAEAMRWYRKAARHGNTYAQNCLKRRGLSW